MAVMNPPNWMQTELHPAERDRELIRSLARPGTVPGATMAVTQHAGTPNMSVDVSEGRMFIPGSENSYQGTYHCEAQGVTVVTIAAADPTNPRRDLIIGRVRDSVYSGATNTFSLEVVQGTPAGSPADPALPSGSCWVLARVAVAAAATSITNANITNFAQGGTGYTGQHGFAAALGGVVVCTSLTRPTTGLYEGLTIDETNTDRHWRYNGSAWRLLSGAVPLVQAYRSGTGQSIANATDTAVLLNGEITDTDSFHSNVTNPSRLTCPTDLDGTYMVTGLVSYTPNGLAGSRVAYLRKNGTITFGRAEHTNVATSANNAGVFVAGMIQLAATDYVELLAVQFSGSPADVSAGAGGEFTQMTMARMGG